MARQKKDAHTITIKMDSQVYNQLEQFCDESGQTKTMAIERILGRYFKGYFDKTPKDRMTL